MSMIAYIRYSPCMKWNTTPASHPLISDLAVQQDSFTYLTGARGAVMLSR